MFRPVQGIDIYMHFNTYNYRMAFSTFMSKNELLYDSFIYMFIFIKIFFINMTLYYLHSYLTENTDFCRSER